MIDKEDLREYLINLNEVDLMNYTYEFDSELAVLKEMIWSRS